MPWMAPRDNLNNRQSLWLTLVARLKPGVSIAQAEASLAPLWHSLRAQELPLYKSASKRFKKSFLDDSHLKVLDDSQGFSPGRMDLKTPLIILMSMAGLLVAMCAINVATLLLLRAAGRAREMSMRYALGAKRSRIVSQLLVEGGLLGLVGAAAGLFLAPVVANALVRLMTNADPGSEPYSTSHRRTRFCSSPSAISVLRQPALQHRAGLSLPAARSGQRAAPESPARQPKTRSASASWPWVRRSRSALCCWAARACSCARSTICATRRSASKPRSSIHSRSIPLKSGYGGDRTSVQVENNVLDAVRRIPGVVARRRHRRPRARRQTPTFPVSRCRATSRPKTRT